MCNQLASVDTSTLRKQNFKIQFISGCIKFSVSKITRYTVQTHTHAHTHIHTHTHTTDTHNIHTHTTHTHTPHVYTHTHTRKHASTHTHTHAQARTHTTHIYKQHNIQIIMYIRIQNCTQLQRDALRTNILMVTLTLSSSGGICCSVEECELLFLSNDCSFGHFVRMKK